MARKPGEGRWQDAVAGKNSWAQANESVANHRYMKSETRRVAADKEDYDAQKDVLKDKYEGVNRKPQADYRKKYGKP